jgi:hypothetical protein
MKSPYRSLAVQTVASGIIMYLVMFVMIDRLSSFYNNLDMAYMTLMMVAPMVVLMILAMPDMFPSKRLNAILLSRRAARQRTDCCHGPVMDPSGGYGVSLYRIEDDQDIEALTAQDPIVKNGVGHYEHFTMLHLRARDCPSSRIGFRSGRWQ